MKKILLMTAFSAASMFGFAQEKSDSKSMSFSGGVEIGMPMGDFGDVASTGFGASLQMNYSLGSKSALILSAGYVTYGGKTISGIDLPSWGWIPVLGGLKYNLSDNFYGSAQAGMSFFSIDGGDSESIFTYAPGIGFEKNKIDISARYLSASKDGATTNTLGLRLGYKF